MNNRVDCFCPKCGKIRRAFMKANGKLEFLMSHYLPAGKFNKRAPKYCYRPCKDCLAH